MDILIKKLFAELLFLMLQMLDGIMSFFRILCGIESVNSDGDKANILDLFLQDNAIVNAFLWIFIISLFVVVLSIIVSIVRTIIRAGKDENKNSHLKTVGLGIGSILTTAAMSVIMLTCIGVSSNVLSYVDSATASNTNLTLSQQIFELCVRKDYKTSYREEAVRDENGNPVFDPETGEQLYEWVLYIQEGESAWWDGATVEQIEFGVTTVDKVFGVHNKDFFGFEIATADYATKPMVNLDDFNMFLAYFVCIMLLVSIIWSMLGLVKRLYDLVVLFLSLPLISATIPADDGVRFKQWRETVISKVVLAFGAVIAINVFMLMLPIILKITISTDSFVNGAFSAFLLIGGALAINGGQLLFARIFGTSAEEARDMANSARALLAGGVAAAHGIKNVKKAAGATTKFGLGATNVAGSVVAGKAYRSPARFIGEKGKTVGNFLRGRLSNPNQNNQQQAQNNNTAEGSSEKPKKNNWFTYGAIGATVNTGIAMGKGVKKVWDKMSGKTQFPTNDISKKFTKK